MYTYYGKVPKHTPSNNNNNNNNKPKKQDPLAWKKVSPRDGKAHQKQVKHPKSGSLRMYNWFPVHNVWTKHSPDPSHPDGCKKAKQQQQTRAASQSSSQQGNSARAIATIFDVEVADGEEE
eukprot:10286925-Ditylum_brightwellii.AAC.1